MNTISFMLIVLLVVAGFLGLMYYIRQRTVALANQLDGRLTQLLEVTKQLARAEGVTEGLSKRNKHEKN